MIVEYGRLAAANQARQQEWQSDQDGNVVELTGLYFGNALAGEVGEACNVIKKLERQRMGMPGSRATKAQLGEELADVMIYLDLLAAKYDIDLEWEVIQKFNKTSEQNGFITRMAPPLRRREAGLEGHL